MSDNIPLDIQVEIIKRLPLKSVIQSRSVSKIWKSLIDGSHFITRYRGQQQHLLVYYYDLVDSKTKYVSVVDDDTFQKNVSFTVPSLIRNLKKSSPVGYSHGLVCVYGDYRKGRNGPVSGKAKVALWNVSIAKAIAVDVHNVASGIYGTVLGFGVCRETFDPKIVKITYIREGKHMESISCIPWQVEVFTLSTGAWRRLYSNLPRKSIEFDCLKSGATVNGVHFWLANDRITVDGGFRSSNVIISFDMTSEEFEEIKLPSYCLAQAPKSNLSVCKFQEYKSQKNRLDVLQECLAVVDRSIGVIRLRWPFEVGLPKGVVNFFIKIITVDVTTPDAIRWVQGIRKTGEPIIAYKEYPLVTRSQSLAVYTPYTKCIKNIGINGVGCLFYTCSYMETLLLLDQPLCKMTKVRLTIGSRFLARLGLRRY